MIAVSCSGCRAKLQVNVALTGKSVRCPKCKQVTTVPGSDVADNVTMSVAPPSNSGNPTVPPNRIADLLASPGPATSSEETTPEQVQEDLAAAAHYKVAGEIARGGMGAIMRAVDKDICREVALKFLLNHADDRQKARFVEEAQITGQLEHPNIVPIHQLGVHEDGRAFFSMKMVKGRSLAEILKDLENGYPLSRFLNIFVSICNALSYAHSREVVHRDLKPANIMIGDFGEVYVMDWGLAKVIGKELATAAAAPSTQIDNKKPVSDASGETMPGSRSGSKSGGKVTTGRTSELTQAGSIMGTPAYMPPEQAKGEEVDQRADIYSLGAILYEMMTLTPPVGRGGAMVAILMRVVEGKIDPPSERAPERARQGWVPSELSAIALKALANKPQDRYPSVEMLKRDIELFLEGRSVSAKQDTAWEILKKLLKRNKGVSIATTAALVVLVVVAGVFYKFNYDARIVAENARSQEQNARIEADKNHEAFVEEQKQRMKQGRDSIPSLLTAARLLLDKRDFKTAGVQVGLALGFDARHPDARNLRGQLALIGQDFAQAQKDLEFATAQRPKDLLTRDLLQWLPQAKANDINSQLVLADIFSRHLAYALADGALNALGENALAVRQKQLALYRQRLDKAWPSRRDALTLDAAKGTFDLHLTQFAGLTDLAPLRGLPLNSVNLHACGQLQDLGALQGMPLTHVNLYGCIGLKDLCPLSGMPLTWLDLNSCQVRDLEPLKGMPLTWLSLAGCKQVEDITPLKGMPLTTLNLTNCPLRDLGPLKGVPITDLNLMGCPVHDLGPLKGMPLTSLDLGFCGQVRDLGPLKGTQLTSLYLSYCGQVQDFEALKGMPLTKLSLSGCPVRDLEPLRGMKLTFLNLQGCVQVVDLGPLKGMPLQQLWISDTGVTDLTPLQDMNLESIGLTPKRITHGLEILRRMTSLRTIETASIAWPAAEFWKKHAEGVFKK